MWKFALRVGRFGEIILRGVREESEMADHWEPNLAIIQNWTNVELVRELRNPMRATCGNEVYVPLLVEAVARLLERKRGPGKVKGLRHPIKRR
jgi:hypothetical protein